MNRCLEELKNFAAAELTPAHREALSDLRHTALLNIVGMLQGAGSGHLGGALSSLDLLLMLYLCANVTPASVSSPGRDRIVVSHGHISSALYTVLGLLGYVDLDKVNEGFRRGGSPFEGHPNKDVPGVEWASGSLGQGLSVGCGLALSARLQRRSHHVFVLMGDGEQQKGQIKEAITFGAKYGLGRLTAIVDFNGLQSSGPVTVIMPQDIADLYRRAGFGVIEVDGHDFGAIYGALRSCRRDTSQPTMILARTVMGKGLPPIENDYRFHGKQLPAEDYAAFLKDAGWRASSTSDRPAGAAPARAVVSCGQPAAPAETCVHPGTPRVYDVGSSVDPREAFGVALADLFRQNQGPKSGVALAAVDCDLVESTRLSTIRDEFPDHFVECGIAEHNAATVTAALSRDGCVPFFVDFAVFGLDETYGQHRMIDFNRCSMKLILTHTGLEVGQDGKTHQCIDYLSLLNNLYGYKLIVPADANQIDRVIRYVATHEGTFVVALGRSPKPVLWNADRTTPSYGRKYEFAYGACDWLREGPDGCIMAIGSMVPRALEVSESLAARGLHVGVLNVSCPKDISDEVVRAAAATGAILTYEDHNVLTGLGSMVGARLAENG
ncbi:MAG TPA: transketolase, partial [Spirochaetia bacterium]|nr:transketolase [Spirochaetia bacterium]